MGDEASLSSFHRDIGIPINFQEESGLGTFWSTALRGPLEVSGDLRPPVQMKLGPRSFLRTAHKIQTSLYLVRMKDEPAFKPLQGNPTFFQVRESRYPLHVRQHIQGPSHIPITEGRLLLRCLWEGGLPL